MIETLEIDQVATYTTRQTMADLKDINFVFGTNGAGKTTIGRVIAQKSKPEHEKCSIVWRKGIEMQPLVYNRDFVDANFNVEENLKGIFTLGEKDIANELAIKAKKEEVDRHSKDIAKHTNTLGDIAKKSGKRKDLAELEADLRNGVGLKNASMTKSLLRPLLASETMRHDSKNACCCSSNRTWPSRKRSNT